VHFISKNTNLPLNDTKQCINFEGIYDNLMCKFKVNTCLTLSQFKNAKIPQLKRQSCPQPPTKVFLKG